MRAGGRATQCDRRLQKSKLVYLSRWVTLCTALCRYDVHLSSRTLSSIDMYFARCWCFFQVVLCWSHSDLDLITEAHEPNKPNNLVFACIILQLVNEVESSAFLNKFDSIRPLSPSASTDDCVSVHPLVDFILWQPVATILVLHTVFCCALCALYML